MFDRDQRVLSEPFMKLPTRKELPDYYEVIKKPVDFYRIKSWVRDGKYNSVDEMESDIMLLCKNAQTYNIDGSLVSLPELGTPISPKCCSILALFTRQQIFDDSVVLQTVWTNARQQLEAMEEGVDDQQHRKLSATSNASRGAAPGVSHQHGGSVQNLFGAQEDVSMGAGDETTMDTMGDDGATRDEEDTMDEDDEGKFSFLFIFKLLERTPTMFISQPLDDSTSRGSFSTKSHKSGSTSRKPSTALAPGDSVVPKVVSSEAYSAEMATTAAPTSSSVLPPRKARSSSKPIVFDNSDDDAGDSDANDDDDDF